MKQKLNALNGGVYRVPV